MEGIKKQIIRQMNQVSCVRRKAMRRWISDRDINRSQHVMLMHLYRAEGLPSQAEIARSMGISEPAVATTLKKMQKAGLIKRNMSERDNRFNEIHITPKGMEIIEQSKSRFEEFDKGVLEGISNEELEAFAKTLGKIGENLEKLKWEGKL